jgi:hypothetical protein
MRLIAIAFVALIANGCSAFADRIDESTMLPLAAALTKLSRAVDAAVRYDSGAAALPEQELLKSSTAHDPSLLEPFAEYAVGLSVRTPDSSVLVCTKDRSRGLLEDAGCTAPLDRHLWQAPEPLACRPVLDLAAVCRR